MPYIHPMLRGSPTSARDVPGAHLRALGVPSTFLLATMNSSIRWMAVTVVLLLWGCDQTGPSDNFKDAQLSDNEVPNEYTFTLSGSVFVNDSDDTSMEESLQRETDELGLEQVRVDVFAVEDETPGEVIVYEEPVMSVLTDSEGRYTFELPAGEWIVRVTPNASQDNSGDEAFNPTLFHSYDSVIDPAERTVVFPQEYGQEEYEEYDPEVTGIDFGFNPDLDQILTDIESGDFQTDARPTRVWRRWLRQAAGERNCPKNRRNWICRDELGGYLASIFSNDGDGVFFGNAEPYELPTGADPFAEGASILREPLKTDLEELRAEVFTLELNFHAGFGSSDPLYDKAIAFYLEERINDLESGSSEASQVTVAEGVVMSSVVAPKSIELQIALAYNGGGGGGEVGN